ncbi:MAG: undecaprenyl-diphosphate phosphatase [Actinomycetales bacterium]|nr:undecaprenyl-diphosphate phosphatase [Actinomycetales bacterium]
MDWLHAIILGIVEGVTEFLPISSTGHLTIVEKLLGYQIDDPGLTAFTAVIQIGAILAAVIYFWKDIVRLATGWFRGVANAAHRDDPDYRMGWNVIIGSVPIAVVGLALQDVIEGPFRSLWVVVGGLIGWSVVLWLADRRGTLSRGEDSVTWQDALVIGSVQSFALIPGVSRSGATISAALLRGIDRVTATRLSFFFGIPALAAAGAMQAVTQAGNIASTVGWGPVVVGAVVSFVVGYASIAWLLRFVASNTFTGFVVYRVALGLLIAGLLVAGVVEAV